jgi:hypothetical protein
LGDEEGYMMSDDEDK